MDASATLNGRTYWAANEHRRQKLSLLLQDGEDSRPQVDRLTRRSKTRLLHYRSAGAWGSGFGTLHPEPQP